MGVSYKKLWKLLIDKNMKKKDLKLATGIGSTTINKLSHDEIVSLEVVVKICGVLGCNIGEIIDVVNVRGTL